MTQHPLAEAAHGSRGQTLSLMSAAGRQAALGPIAYQTEDVTIVTKPNDIRQTSLIIFSCEVHGNKENSSQASLLRGPPEAVPGSDQPTHCQERYHLCQSGLTPGINVGMTRSS